jgi:hypothetical protein
MRIPAIYFRALLPAVFILLAGPVQSNPIYKCINNEGRVTYSAMPCYGERWKRMGAPESPPPKPQPTTAPAPVSVSKPSPSSTSAASPSAGSSAVNAAVNAAVLAK